jgi:hypothetical protein
MARPTKHRCGYCGRTVTDGRPTWTNTTAGALVKWMCERCHDGLADARDLAADLRLERG